MDIITTIINNVSPVVQNGSTGAGSDLPEKFLSDLGKFLNNSNPSTNNTGNVTALGNNTYSIRLPALSSIIQGTNSITVKTDQPIDNIGNFKIQGDSFSFNNVNSNPILQIKGTITALSGQNTAPVKFTSEVPLSKEGVNIVTGNSASATATQKVDGVNLTAPTRPNLLNFNAYTNNISQTISSKIPANSGITTSLIKADSLTSYNLQVQSFVYPSGKSVITGATRIPEQYIITGKIEYSPQNNQTLIKTEFGNFRVPGELSLPNNSTVNFTINAISNVKPEAQINESFNLNLNSVKLVLENEGSALQNLINNLANLPHGNSILSRLFPSFTDKQSFARSLWFISSSISGDADQWLGNEGKGFIRANFANPENVMSNLKEVFGLLKSLNTNPQVSNNPDSWYNYVIPFYDNKKLEFLSFYVQPKDSGNKQDKNNGRKFMVEFEQSELGQVVVEGLYTEKNNRVDNLDLQLSSTKGFSLELSEELSILFNDISEAYGFTGSINFSSSIPSDYKKVLTQTSTDGIII